MTPAVYPHPRNVHLTGGSSVVRQLTVQRDSSMAAQGYRLVIDAEGARLVAADDAGERYGRSTFQQWCDAHATEASIPRGATPHVVIDDHPDLAVRGVMLDVSRDKVPTMQTLLRLVEQLAKWRYNQLQLYIEHTFAFTGYDDVWWYADPFTPDQIRQIDQVCQQVGIELVPNQNCLGHMERWLRVPRLRSMAARPDGFQLWGMQRGPTTLDPANPAAFQFVRGLLREVLPCYSSRQINVGLDEPWEFGDGRRDEYVQWVRRLRDLPELDGYDVQVWGDVLTADPTLVASLPDGVTVNEWGYEADHDFTGRGRACQQADRPWMACAGTSSWQTILGRTTNMHGNISAATEAARGLDARGMLVTDWGDFGHLQCDAVRLPPLALAAGLAWCAASNSTVDLGSIADPAAIALGDVYLATDSQIPNCSRLVRHLYFPQVAVRRLTLDECDRAEADLDAGVVLLRDRDDLDADGLRWGADLTRLAIADARARLAADGTIESVPAATRRTLADQAQPLIDRHRELWLRSNRAGGLDDSVRWLTNVLAGYTSGVTDLTWPYPTVDLTTATAGR